MAGQASVRVCLAMALLAAVAAAPTPKPNVIFLLADDWGWGDVGAYAQRVNSGERPPVTPNLDKLVSQGTAFTRFHTMASVCSPSRASWMTGSWPLAVKSPYIFSCNAALNAAKGQGNYVPTNVTFLTRTLHDAGYATAHYGKWHLGCTPDAPAPAAYQIDDSATYCSNKAVAPQLDNSSDPWFPSNSSRLIVDHGIKFAQGALAAKKPFYMNLWFHISHAPLLPTDEQLANFPVEKYCPWSGMHPQAAYPYCPIQVFRASQHDLDTQVGRLMDFLETSKAIEDTLIVFSGDNGPEDPHVYFNSVGSAGLYRGRKRSLYEGGIGVPLIVRWDGHVPAGRFSEADLASIDWFPTLAALAGITLDAKAKAWIKGQDASNLLLGKAEVAKTRTIPLMWDYRFNMPGTCFHQSPRLAIMDPGWELKLLLHPDHSRVELYNVSHDRFESTNIAAQFPDVVDRLSKQVIAWTNSMPPTPAAALHPNAGCAASEPVQGHPLYHPDNLLRPFPADESETIYGFE